MRTPAQQIRDLVAKDTVLMPGVYDALTARIAARVGFDITFISGYSVSAARLGEPDFGFLTQTEMADATRAVTRVSNAPVIVDADTGYGNAVNVMRTVQDFQDAGAAGVFLEDQVWPEKCGHFQGKQVIPAEEHATKIRAAADARGERDLVIVVRTDARQPLGLDAAIERGVTPHLSRSELRDLGFQLIVCPLAALYAAARAVTDVLTELRESETTAGMYDRMLAFDEFGELVGLEQRYADEARYG